MGLQAGAARRVWLSFFRPWLWGNNAPGVAGSDCPPGGGNPFSLFVTAASRQGSACSFLTLSYRAPSQRGLGLSKGRISSSILGLLL